MAKSLSRHSGGIQMTEGSLYKNILLFSIPLIFSQLLQVLFNIADVAVVGKFSSAAALGSVGSTTTLVSLFTAFSSDWATASTSGWLSIWEPGRRKAPATASTPP